MNIANLLQIIIIPVLNDNYIYLLHESASATTAVVDPALAEPVLDILAKKAWRLNYIFNTHHHQDHIGGNLQLKQQTGCQIIAAAADRQRIPGIDHAVQGGNTVSLGQINFQIIATPGHTLGHIVYYNPTAQVLFCGDTLFSLGCGRLFEGTAAQMHHSLQQIKTLPPATRIYCAHEYSLSNARFALSLESSNTALQQRAQEITELRAQNLPTIPTTLAQELATNPFLRPNSSAIRTCIAAKPDATDLEVFTRIRVLKDRF